MSFTLSLIVFWNSMVLTFFYFFLLDVVKFQINLSIIFILYNDECFAQFTRFFDNFFAFLISIKFKHFIFFVVKHCLFNRMLQLFVDFFVWFSIWFWLFNHLNVNRFFSRFFNFEFGVSQFSHCLKKCVLTWKHDQKIDFISFWFCNALIFVSNTLKQKLH